VYKDVDIVTDIKTKRLEVTGHKVIVGHERVVTKIYKSKPKRMRRMGKQRPRWLKDTEKEIWEKVKIWRKKAINIAELRL
jgi:hypothetical protein